MNFDFFWSCSAHLRLRMAQSNVPRLQKPECVQYSTEKACRSRNQNFSDAKKFLRCTRTVQHLIVVADIFDLNKQTFHVGHGIFTSRYNPFHFSSRGTFPTEPSVFCTPDRILFSRKKIETSLTPPLPWK